MSDFRPPIRAALDAFGQPATVIPPGASAVKTRAIWLPPFPVEYPTGSEFRRAEARRSVALPLEGLTEVPRGTIIRMAAEQGSYISDWKVDEASRVDSDHYRAVVVSVVP